MNTRRLLSRLTLGLFAASLCSCSRGGQPPASEGAGGDTRLSGSPPG